jgi:acyl-[acyl-carrier-protein]-phospholipid O-acyltransferase/long-chain-fatty-acid--[acyl-carrier-protein] ligase
MCDTLLKGQVSAHFTPHAAAGIAFFTALMVATTPAPTHEGLIGVPEFLSNSMHWPVLLSMLMVAMCGGIYIVPLYSMLQSGEHAHYRSRIIAASGLSDAIFMTLGAIISSVLLLLGFTILDLFLVIALLTIGVIWYARRIFA